MMGVNIGHYCWMCGQSFTLPLVDRSKLPFVTYIVDKALEEHLATHVEEMVAEVRGGDE